MTSLKNCQSSLWNNHNRTTLSINPFGLQSGCRSMVLRMFFPCPNLFKHLDILFDFPKSKTHRKFPSRTNQCWCESNGRQRTWFRYHYTGIRNSYTLLITINPLLGLFDRALNLEFSNGCLYNIMKQNPKLRCSSIEDCLDTVRAGYAAYSSVRYFCF